MSYQSRETSIQDGAPIELYRFSSGSQSWYYTSDELPFEYLGSTYLPISIRCTAPEMASEKRLAKITMTVSKDHPVARLFGLFAPPGGIWLTILRTHLGDDEVLAYWQGQVRGVAFTSGDGGAADAQIEADPIDGLLQEAGLHYNYQQACNHTLYGVGCGLVPADYKVSGVVASVSGREVSIAAATSFDPGRLVTGFLARQNGDYRMINVQAGDLLTLTSPFPGLVIGEQLELYPGCNRAIETCRLFNNLVNYGGFKSIPDTNPFETGLEP